jgi:hypothetical protein
VPTQVDLAPARVSGRRPGAASSAPSDRQSVERAAFVCPGVALWPAHPRPRRSRARLPSTVRGPTGLESARSLSSLCRASSHVTGDAADGTFQNVDVASAIAGRWGRIDPGAVPHGRQRSWLGDPSRR